MSFLVTIKSKEYVDKFANSDTIISSKDIDYSSIFMNKQKDYSDEKYSDFTKDKLLRWDTVGTWQNDNTISKLNDVPTLYINDKEVNFPINFSFFGDEFAPFDHYDFTKISNNLKEDDAFMIKSKNTSAFIHGMIDESDGKNLFLLLYNKNSKFIACVCLNPKTFKIVGLVNHYYGLSPYNFKINKIGVGSTFNEVYEKFSTPDMINITDSTKIISYHYIDLNNNKGYLISFLYYLIAYNPKSGIEERVSNNTVLGIIYTMYEIN